MDTYTHTHAHTPTVVSKAQERPRLIVSKGWGDTGSVFSVGAMGLVPPGGKEAAGREKKSSP